LLVSQEALSGLLGNVFRTPVRLKASLATFNSIFGSRINELVSASEDGAAILQQLGLVAANG
jgi:hypothetical protein